MEQRSVGDLFIDLGREQGSLHHRLAVELRRAVREGRLPDGARMPSSRSLATELGVSRWVVVEAYDQLAAEGYVATRPGSGTVVRAVSTTVPSGSRRTIPPPARAPLFDLAPGIPDLRAFPRSRWLEAHRLAVTDRSHADLGSPAGIWEPAAATVADYLQRARGVALDDAVVGLTRGSTAAAGMLARELAGAGYRSIAVEDPSWPGLRDAFAAVGFRIVAIGVDDEGLRVDQLRAASGVRLVITTPAHQFPTGVPLSPARRRALLDWAAAVDGVVVEDDYDAEFRYDHRPVAALQGMAPDRVILLGSVSKTLAPSLELGWIVVPDRWHRRLPMSCEAPTLFEQATLSTMISRGWYERHLVRVRRRYRARRQRLLAALAEALPSSRPSGIAAGLHVELPLPHRADEDDVAATAASHDLRLAPASRYRVEPSVSAASDTGSLVSHPSLIIGYGNLRDGAEREAARRLHRSIIAAQ